MPVTDFCVGLILQPLYVYVTYTAFRVKDIRGDVLYRVYNICGIISTILSTVSVLTSTAISVDRLLVLMLEMRYRHVVTLDRVRGVVIGFWLLGASTLPVWLWSKENFYRGPSLIVLLCLITSTSCYVKIHLLNTLETSRSDKCTKPLPITTEWTWRESAQHCKI